MSDVGIFYASTSGRTRKLIPTIEEALAPLSTSSYDLRNSAPEDLAGHSILLLGSPTYGTGDWHHLWQKWADRLADASVNFRHQSIGVFALGDARHHKDSFAGAIAHLSELAESLGGKLIGRTAYDPSYDRTCCEPILTEGCFPGLVLDPITQRQASGLRIAAWANQLKRECSAHLASYRLAER